MPVIIAILFMTLPTFALAQRAPDEFCESLNEIESLSDDDYKLLEQWAEADFDRLLNQLKQLNHVEAPAGMDMETPDNWLRHHFAIQLADCYMTGRGTKKDIRKAMAILEIPASEGHEGSAHMLASIQLFQSDDPVLQRRGFAVLQEEAEDGSAYSAGKLGWAYAMGLGIEKDEERALELYFVAANAGMTYWQYSLAHAYEQGYFGLPVDEERANYWREFEPKSHITTYECQVASNYERGLYPTNLELERRYRQQCDAAY